MSARINGYGDAPQSNVEYITTIHDTDWAGALTFFEIAHGGIKIKWASGETDNRHAPILGSSCDITMLVDTFNQTVLEVFLEDLRTSSEGRFWLEITSNGTYATVWRGVIIADNSYEKDQATPYEVTISAVDGIALLKKEPYLNSGALYTGTNTAIRHITRCLQKMPHIAFWGSSDPFLETSLDWWADTMSAGGANDPLLLSYIDHAAFYDYHTTGSIDKDVISCYDVLKNILIAFGARIQLLGDMFRVEQIDYRANHIYEYRRYDQTGAALSHSTHSGINNINQTAASGAKVSYVTYDYIPQLWKAQVTYEAKLRRNFWGNILLAESVTYNFNQEISSNSGAATFRIKGMFWVTIKNKVFGGYTGSLADVIFAEMGLTLKIGSNYLKREGVYSTTGFSWHPNPAEWTASAADKFLVVGGGNSVPPSGISSSFYLPFDIITPPLPSDGSANATSATFIRLKRNSGDEVDESQFEITWTASSMRLEVFDLGTPDVQEDEMLYESVNPGEGSEIWEASTRLGGGSANYAGRLMNSSNVPWAQWGAGVSARDQPIGGLLADTVLNGQLRAIKRLSGDLYGVIDPLKLIHTSDGIDWLMMTATWSVTEDIISGSWFEVDYGSAAVTSTPIKVKITETIKLPTTSFPIPPVSTGNGNQGFASNSPGVVLAPIAWNTLSSPILEGATVTSIPLTEASSGSDFLAGDVVTLAHPITGKYQNFTVSSAPSAGATSLAVTSATAEFDAPTGTFLVVKQKAYSFSLPTATTLGQILRWNGSAWVAFSGTNTQVLTWQTGSGWVSAAPATSGTVTSVAATAPAAGVTISGSPITGAGTFVFALANDLAALEALASTGIAVRSATDTWVQRTMTGTSNRLSVLNGNGVSGNPTFDIDSAYVGQATITTLGTITTGVWNGTDILFAAIQQISTAIFLGRNTAGTGDIEQLSIATAKTMLGLTGSNSGDVTLAGENYLSIASQVITALAVNLGGTNVTGTLAAARFGALTGDVTNSAGSYATTIAANAVTLAKMAQVATAIFLGRTTAGTGNVEAMTVTQATALLNVFTSALKGLVPASGGGTTNYLRADGSWAAPAGTGVTQSTTLASGRITHSSGSNLVTDTANHLWDNTNGRETIIPQVAGLGGGAAALNINPPGAGTLTSMEGLRIWGNINGNLISVLSNTNTGASSAAIFTIETQGDTGGDPILQFHIAGTGGHYTALGLDNSDSNKFKITPNAASPGFLTNVGLTMTQTATTLVGINKDNPSYELHVGGRTMSDAFYNTTNTWSSGFISFGVGAGTGPSISSISGGANWMSITFTTGTSPTANGNIFTATYPQAFPAFPTYVVFSASNANAATDYAKFYMSGGTAGGFNMQANGTLTASTQYKLDFHIGGTG